MRRGAVPVVSMRIGDFEAAPVRLPRSARYISPSQKPFMSDRLLFTERPGSSRIRLSLEIFMSRSMRQGKGRGAVRVASPQMRATFKEVALESAVWAVKVSLKEWESCAEPVRQISSERE